MSDANATRTGQINGAGDVYALFLKKFGGEVMVTFQENNVFMPLHMIRNIDSGKSAQFPAHGRTVAEYHVPGQEIVGNVIKGNERIINIDNLLVAHVFIPKIDEAMSHYDVRSIYTGLLGRALAKEADTYLGRLLVLAARASATVSGEFGGQSVTKANAKTVGADLAAALFEAAQKMDEQENDETDRYAALLPAQYFLLAQTTAAINKDWGGRGAYADGTVLRVAGIQLVKSVRVPSTNVTSSPTGTNNTYHGDFSTTVAPVWQKAAIGTVKLLDLALESEYQISRQGTLMVAKYAMGHGILRPECAVEIKTA